MDCSDRQLFSKDDYIIVYGNLLLLNEDNGLYHACGFYTPLETEEDLGEYDLEQMYVGGEVAVCSKKRVVIIRFFGNSGKIKETGKITLLKIYFFDYGLYNSTRDSVNNIDRGKLVLNLTATVE